MNKQKEEVFHCITLQYQNYLLCRLGAEIVQTACANNRELKPEDDQKWVKMSYFTAELEFGDKDV